MKRRAAITVLVLGAFGALGACDTGDGTTIKEPATPTTAPPIDTTPLASVAIDASTLPAEPTASVDPSTSADVIGDAAVSSTTGSIELFAPWAEGGTIDPVYGCAGSNISPALSWTGVPDGTAELAVSLVDESNLSNGQPFVHWVIGGIGAEPTGTLGEGDVPIGAVQALNFFGDIGYAGPCPNLGESNTYRLTVYALGQQLELPDGTPATEFLDLVNTVSIGSASVTGTSSR